MSGIAGLQHGDRDRDKRQRQRQTEPWDEEWRRWQREGMQREEHGRDEWARGAMANGVQTTSRPE